jgi:hypothetical protein
MGFQKLSCRGELAYHCNHRLHRPSHFVTYSVTCCQKGNGRTEVLR